MTLLSVGLILILVVFYEMGSGWPGTQPPSPSSPGITDVLEYHLAQLAVYEAIYEIKLLGSVDHMHTQTELFQVCFLMFTLSNTHRKSLDMHSQFPLFVSCFISSQFSHSILLMHVIFSLYSILSFLPTNFSKNSECHWVHAHCGCIFKSICVYECFSCLYIHAVATHGSQKTPYALKPDLQ